MFDENLNPKDEGFNFSDDETLRESKIEIEFNGEDDDEDSEIEELSPLQKLLTDGVPK